MVQLFHGTVGAPELGEWGLEHPSPESHALETHVYCLRQKIEPDPTKARLLVTA